MDNIAKSFSLLKCRQGRNRSCRQLVRQFVLFTACACCFAVAGGCMASVMAGIGIAELTMDMHAIAQSR